MKSLFKRSVYFLLDSKLLIGISIFIGLSIFVPFIIGISYTPNIKLDSLFGDRDIAAENATGKLFCFMILMGIFLTAMILYIPLKILSIDKETNWNIFLSTTPVKRKNYVTEKYILALLIIVVLCLFYSVSFGVIQVIESQSAVAFHSVKPRTHTITESSIDIKSIILFVAILQSIYMIIISSILPPYFFSGSKKGMIGYIISLVTVIVVTSMTIVIANTSRKDNIIKSFFSADPLLVAFFVFLFSCGLCFLSWLISQWIYKKREF